MREASRWDIFDEKVVGFELTLPGGALGTRGAVVEYVGQLTRVTYRDGSREYSAEHEDEAAAWLKLLALRRSAATPRSRASGIGSGRRRSAMDSGASDHG